MNVENIKGSSEQVLKKLNEEQIKKCLTRLGTEGIKELLDENMFNKTKKMNEDELEKRQSLSLIEELKKQHELLEKLSERIEHVEEHLEDLSSILNKSH